MDKYVLLFDDDLYRVYLALSDQNLDDRYIFKLRNNDVLFSVASELSTETNFGTGSVFAFADDYAKIYEKYLQDKGYNKDIIRKKVKDQLKEYMATESDDDINFVLQLAGISNEKQVDVGYEERRIQINLDNLADQNAEIFDEYKMLAKHAEKLIITNDPEPKTNDVTYYYDSESGANQVYKFETIPLNITIAAAHKKSIRVYEYAKKLPDLIESLKKDNYEDLVLKLYTGNDYRTGVYNHLSDEFTIYNTKKTVFDEHIPPGYHSDLSTNVTISWTIYNIGIDLDALVYSILSNQIMSRYFQIIETEKPYMMKKRDEMYFINTVNKISQKYKFVIHRQKLPTNRIVDLLKFASEAYLEESDEGLTTEEIKRDTNYIHITLYNIPNEYKAKRIKFMISALLRMFAKEYQKEIIDGYAKVFSWYKPQYQSKKQRNEDRDTKINALQAIAPEIFVNNYARLCLEDKQGEIIPENELKKWQKENPDRRYLKFPKDAKEGDITIYMVCPDAKNKYPSIKPNFYLPNREKYPYVPCCSAIDPLASQSSTLYKYLHNIPDEQDIEVIASKQSNRKMDSVDKLLGLGRKGSLPNSIIKLLNNYGVNGEIERFGVYKSVNTLIHCIMFAMDQPYLSYNLRGREIYASNWRHIVSGHIPAAEEYAEFNRNLNANKVKELGKQYIASAKQELYDYSSDMIISELRDVYSSFDSDKYYRLLESYYKINIMVLVLPKDGDPYLEVPRHKIFHIRARRETLPTILIFKHYGKLNNSHYEIIKVNNNYFLNDIKLFDMYDDIYSTYVLRKQGIGKPVTYKNVYSFFIHKTLIAAGLQINGQYLDTYGKCRGYLVTTSDGYTGSILCIPQQPLALNIVDEIVPLPVSVINNLFGDSLISRTHVINDIIKGVWYSVYDYDLGIYVPAVVDKQNKAIDNTKKFASNPLVPIKTEGDFQTLINLEEVLNKFLSIITRLYKLYAIEVLNDIQNEEKPSTDAKFEERTIMQKERLIEFSNNFKTVSDKNHDYDMDDINVNDIKDMTFDEGLAYIEEKSNNTVVSNGFILMQTKKLRKDMQYYVYNMLVKQPDKFYERTEVIGLPSHIFTSIQEFELWVASKIHPNSVLLNASDINNSRKDPFMYRDDEGFLYIIQNVLDGDVSRATNVALEWAKKDGGRVLGYNAPPLSIVPPVSNIYKIYGKELIMDLRNNSELNLIQFSDNMYAALLPL